MSPAEPVVPVLSIAIFALNILISLAIPTALFLVFQRKYKCKAVPFFVGAATFIVFAMILEPVVHLIAGLNDPNSPIVQNIWLYAVYGGIAAGLFEETGRFIAMKFLLRKYYNNDHNALMYGAGHGGAEAVLLLGAGALNNIIYSVILNMGMESTLLDSAPTEALKQQVQMIFDQLKATSPLVFLISPIERIFAVSLHIALSVLVWIAVTRKGKTWLYPLALFLHAFADASMAIANSLSGSLVVTELYISVICVLVCFLAYRMWKANGCPAGNSTADNNTVIINDQGEQQ
ncbi:MAG: YhfC family intramembrane metalloprotease [Ruminiclostridium sp.]|nr:YhfC family intramembrane metalloprotease [Ruminiclostridium sp.]